MRRNIKKKRELRERKKLRDTQKLMNTQDDYRSYKYTDSFIKRKKLYHLLWEVSLFPYLILILFINIVASKTNFNFLFYNALLFIPMMSYLVEMFKGERMYNRDSIYIKDNTLHFIKVYLVKERNSSHHKNVKMSAVNITKLCITKHWIIIYGGIEIDKELRKSIVHYHSDRIKIPNYLENVDEFINEVNKLMNLRLDQLLDLSR